jgi:hypothetical protein
MSMETNPSMSDAGIVRVARARPRTRNAWWGVFDFTETC